MIKHITNFFPLFLFFGLNAQTFTFSKQWDKRYGGTKGEGNPVLLQTTDSGYLVGGYSYSGISGDKTEDNRNSAMTSADYWVVKIDANGNKEWDKRFGTIQEDFFHVVQQTSDGGYILGGHTGSGINGDKTETSRGGTDFWVVKINSNGNKEWDKRYGGSSDEGLTCLQQTKDGGYIFCGTSSSGIGGDKTEDNRSGGFYFDYWIVKTDSLGIKHWDKRYGGTDDDIPNDIKQTNDGGYILVGNSYSRAGGDKTQDNWDTLNPLSPDGWVVKIDSLGFVQWDKRIGTAVSDGLWAVIQTPDSGYFLSAGSSYNGTNGDKTTSKWGNWYMKLNNTGNIIWQKSYVMGAGNQVMKNTKDGGYLISGQATVSNQLVIPPALERTEDCLGVHNSLVLKLDSNGFKQWDKMIFTTGDDGGGYAVETTEGCYAIANISNGGVGGYKTQPNWDTATLNPVHDFFILKFCMDTVTGITELTDQPQISVSPNPFATDISISIQKENLHQATFTITNFIGQAIYHGEETNLANSYTKMLDLSYLPNGMYLLEVIIDGQRTVKQIIKQ